MDEEHHKTSDARLKFEERKLALDEEMARHRLRLEQERHERESSLLHAHLGVLVTALISIATVILSLVQFYIATMKSDQEAEFQHRQRAEEARVQQDEWRLNVLKYLSEHREEIYSTDPKVRDQVRTILEATLPHEVLVNVLSELSESSTSADAAATWSFDVQHQWVEVAVGNCEGNDVPPETAGPTPDPKRCDNAFAGEIAVCPEGKPCAYKNVQPGDCTDGENPGRIYRCVAEVIRKTPAANR